MLIISVECPALWTMSQFPNLIRELFRAANELSMSNRTGGGLLYNNILRKGFWLTLRNIWLISTNYNNLYSYTVIVLLHKMSIRVARPCRMLLPVLLLLLLLSQALPRIMVAGFSHKEQAFLLQNPLYRPLRPDGQQKVTIDRISFCFFYTCRLCPTEKITHNGPPMGAFQLLPRSW